MAVCAGPEFELSTDLLAETNERVEEMDRVEVIELDQSTFKYQKGLVEVFRSVEDPFSNEVMKLSFEPNPAEPTAPISTVELVEGDAAANNLNRIL